MAEILKDVFEDDKGNQHYLANNTETTYDQEGVPLNNGGDLSEASVNFSVSTTRKSLTAKARFKALMGDIAKWLADLGTAAFCAVANNDTTTAAGFVADARIVKQHGDEIDGINSDLADGQIEFDFQGGKGVYRQKGADTWLPFRQPIMIDTIYATYGAAGMNVNGGGGVMGLNVEGYNKVSMGPFTYVKNRTFYINYTKKDGTVISHNKTASFTSFEFDLVDAVKLSMYMSGFSAEAVSECKNIIIT